MLRIVYVSNLRPTMSVADLDALVKQAAAFNQANDITGVLALEDGRVCQILEGPDEAVAALFASIRKDERHTGVTELTNHAIDRYSFEGWGMARRSMVDMVTFAFAA
jgi:acylphosphatase